MDRVQRTELHRQEGSRGAKDAFVDPDEIHAGQDILASPHCSLTERQ